MVPISIRPVALSVTLDPAQIPAGVVLSAPTTGQASQLPGPISGKDRIAEQELTSVTVTE